MKADVDFAKNRLLINWVGVATPKKMEKLYSDVRFCVADLTPGFDAVSDYSHCELLHLDSIPALKKIMSYLIENGVGEIVRVLPKSKISHKQILNLATRVQSYKPFYVSNIAEAEERLEQAVKRNGIRVHLRNLPMEYMIKNEAWKGGHITDMSKSGCAVEFITGSPKADEDVLLKVTFTKEDNSPDLFEINAKIVRVSTDSFAAEFKDFNNESQERLWQYLIRESRS